MKEITRRLYTKPVMLGMAFFMGMALVAGLLVTARSRAAAPFTVVPAGNDEFETLGDGETYHDFESAPIPANFFGSGSLAYGELVPLEGVPLSSESNVDTIIEREQDVSVPGGSTPITMTGLSLKSINPITVSYSSGATESWNVHVGLSLFKASTGTMTINSSSFDSTLKVWPRFTFTRNGVTKVLDTGGSGSGLTAPQAAVSDGSAMESDSATAPTMSRCASIAVNDFNGFAKATTSATATSTSTCPPVTLTSTNSPWVPCAPSGFCIPVPITEEERWARHRPHPKGTKKAIASAE